MRKLVLTIAFALAGTGCKTSGPNDASSLKDNTATGALTPHAAGSVGNRIEPALRQRILDEMKKVAGWTFESVAWSTSCIEANRAPNWSDVAFHYYCRFPAYLQTGEPRGIRACWTASLRGSSPFKQFNPATRTFNDLYSYCLYDGTPGNEIKTVADYAGMPLAGSFKYIEEELNRGEVYKFLMFSNPKAFNAEDQNWIVNSFYGIDVNADGTMKNPTDAECSKRPARSGTSTAVADNCHGKGYVD